MGGVEGRRAIVGDADLVALHPQRALQHLGDRIVILDDENAGGRSNSVTGGMVGAGVGGPRESLASVDRLSCKGSPRAPVEAISSEMAARSKTRPKPKPRSQPAARRKPTASRAAPRSRARRSPLASRPSLPSVVLESHHVDILALALIAVGIFLGGVAYLHWAGGALGDGAVRGIRYVFGALGYAVPAGLVAAGGLILARELRPPARPLRAGLLCLMAALTLALAAGTLGLGPGAASGHAFWRASSFENRGGVVGQGELWVASHLLSTLGADILAIFLLIAGVILVTGATLRRGGARHRHRRARDRHRPATLRRGPGRDPGAAPGDGGGARRHRHRRDRTGSLGDPDFPPEPLLPPSPDTDELIIRATHVEAPPISGPAPAQDQGRCSSISGPSRNPSRCRRSPNPSRSAARRSIPRT